MARTFAYSARIQPDEAGRLLVTFPDLPEALTDGATQEEALAEAADALGTALAGRIADGAEIPAPSATKRGTVRVAPNATIAAKVALYLAMREEDISVAELARRMGVDHKEARRIVSPREATKLPRLEEALAAVGQEVELVVRPRKRSFAITLPAGMAMAASGRIVRKRNAVSQRRARDSRGARRSPKR